MTFHDKLTVQSRDCGNRSVFGEITGKAVDWHISTLQHWLSRFFRHYMFHSHVDSLEFFRRETPLRV